MVLVAVERLLTWQNKDFQQTIDRGNSSKK
jgi:hypothetical protein